VKGRTGVKVGAGLGLLVALWAAAAVPAVGDAARVVSGRAAANDLGRPIGAVVLALEAERRLSVGQLVQSSPAAGPAAGSAQLTAQRTRTDQAGAELRRIERGSRLHRLIGADATRQADDLLDRLDRLAGLRIAVDARRLDRDQVLDSYTAIIDPAGPGTALVYPDQQAGSAAGLVALSRAREALAQEDALLTGALTGPRLAEADRVRLAGLAGAQRGFLAAAAADLPATATARYRELPNDPRLVRLRTMENDLILGSASAPAPAAWTAAFNPVNAALWELQVAATHDAADAATPHAVTTIVRAGVIGGVGLVAVIGVLVLARRTAKRSNRAGAAPDPRPIPGGAPPGDGGQPLNGLLRDLDRRNQALLHRQLRLLDGLARRESDDEALGDLFRADHLANRMRRNLEKAISLTGGIPGRRWRRPMPLAEIVRAAASEVVEYARVSTSQIEPADLTGAAVTDLMHLLAELIENATTFAPAQTRVRVTGTRRPGGYAVTVTDVGPGMTDDDLATAHVVMSDPAPPASGTWWGLYAAGRFADRQGFLVRLTNGPTGGLVAEVAIPDALLAETSPAEPATAGRIPARPDDADATITMEPVSSS
jgi:signal transduction histidine kinase